MGSQDCQKNNKYSTFNPATINCLKNLALATSLDTSAIVLTTVAVTDLAKEQYDTTEEFHHH